MCVCVCVYIYIYISRVLYLIILILFKSNKYSPLWQSRSHFISSPLWCHIFITALTLLSHNYLLSVTSSKLEAPLHLHHQIHILYLAYWQCVGEWMNLLFIFILCLFSIFIAHIYSSALFITFCFKHFIAGRTLRNEASSFFQGAVNEVS